MHAARIQVTGRLRRGIPGALALALVTASALAGANPAAAAQHSAAVPRDAGRPAGPVTAAGTISTVAGGLGGPAKGTKVALGYLCGLGYGAGSVYVGSATVVRKLNPDSGQTAPVAGNGLIVGPSGDGGPALAADLGNACTTAVDQHGNLVIVDPSTGTIEVVAATTGTFYGQQMTAGDIYSVGGSFGQLLDGGLAVDSAGNLVFTNGGPNIIEVVAESNGTFYGQKMTAGGLFVVAGTGHHGFSGDGGPATKAKLNHPGAVTLDHAGNLVFNDDFNNRVRVVADKTGTFYGKKMTAGDIYTVAGDGTATFSGDGGPATAAGMSPGDVTVDAAGNLVIAGNGRVRVVALKTGTFYGQAMKAGDIYTVAGNGESGFSGDGGPATAAEFDGVAGVRVDGAGNLVIADSDNKRVRVVAVKTGTFYGKKMTAQDIYTVAGNGTQDSSGNGGAAIKAELDPGSVTLDGAGNMVIPDTNGDQIRVAATRTGAFYAQHMTAGHIYTVAGGGTGALGDGGPATKASLFFPHAVAVDGAGNLVIADFENERVRVVAVTTGTFYGQAMKAGDIYTVAGNGNFGFSGDGGPATKAKLWLPRGVAVDAAGNVVITDSNNDRVRVVAVRTGTFYGRAMKAGDIYTVAGGGVSGLGDGGPATAAELGQPSSVAVDAAGNLVIADIDNDRVRVVAVTTGTFYGQAMKAGDIYTVAGGGASGLGDGGPATAAQLSQPAGVSLDGSGNLLIADTDASRIRVVAVTTGTFYGQAMKAGDIYTVAGDGTQGFSGDGGPATTAELYFPQGVAVNQAGGLLIADASGRIREVSG
jgi:hypothetical protein